MPVISNALVSAAALRTRPRQRPEALLRIASMRNDTALAAVPPELVAMRRLLQLHGRTEPPNHST